MLPDARYLGATCGKCNQYYWIDLGGKDRHEYMTIIKSVKTTCPLCGHKMKTPDNFTYYGCVSN